MALHPKYFEAKRRLNQLADKYPTLREPRGTIALNNRWNEAFEKDDTGLQCYHLVVDWEEKLAAVERMQA